MCGIPLLFVAIWFDQPLPWFTVLVAIWGLLAALEFYKMVAGAKVPPLTYFGLIWVLLFILSRDAELTSAIEPHLDLALLTPILTTSVVVLSLIWLLVRPQKEEAFIGWVWTLAGILYLGWMLSHLVALRGLDDGRNWVFLALSATFAYDTVAYFVGRAWGTSKLAEHPPQVENSGQGPHPADESFFLLGAHQYPD